MGILRLRSFVHIVRYTEGCWITATVPVIVPVSDQHGQKHGKYLKNTASIEVEIIEISFFLNIDPPRRGCHIGLMECTGADGFLKKD